MSIGEFASGMPAGTVAALEAFNVIRALKHPLAVADADGRVLFSNPAFAELFTHAGCDAALGRRPDACLVTAKDGRLFSLETAALSDGLLIIATNVSEPAAADPERHETARMDALTQLGDRQMFREHLTALLASSAGDIEPVAVLLVNLNRFKTVNDSLGHAVGDKLLRVVADRLRTTLGAGAFAARLGGDEFAIIEPCLHAQSAGALADRLIDLLGRSYIVDGHLLNIGITVGVALIPAHATSYEQVLKNASLALHHAKLAGQGSYRFFSGIMQDEIQARRDLEIDLRRALALRELSLVYQPQFHIASKQITGFEALLRWHHPKRGLVSPSEFIPLAEEIGLIVPIGEWVLRTACRDAALWPYPLKIAVNISAVQFRSPTLADVILSGLTESGLSPNRLELEITESTLLTDYQDALDLLHKIRGLGVHVAMDDFGTGYSSLSYLRSFPFDKIKIDQSFIRNHPNDPTGNAIVRSIAALGHSLGVTTVAEGVETDEQLARITADGCTDVQGYLISKPIAADEIAAFLQARMQTASAP